MTDSDMDAILRRLLALVAKAGLPGVEESTSYGRPALKVGGRAFVSVRNGETIVLSLPIEDKEHLIEMAPDIYYQTDHYRGWPSLPLWAAAIGDDELQQRLVEAWRFRAPRKVIAAFDARQS
ncbi:MULTISPECIES: MmcQ/YjbR family DNA-binding protein [unclassified Sinorhizobium]|uniref:MmcQ/YjbR family DNA-binding protein n=1 Tax=unclassified Sinorhizobium TaxID=2613772 RepID=UPI0035266E99